MLRQEGKVLWFALVASLLLTCTSYADVSNPEEYSRLLQQANNSLVEYCGTKITEESGDCYIVGKDGNPWKGFSYDATGEIYFTPEETPEGNGGYCYRNTKDGLGVYYDDAGRAQNPSMGDMSKFRGLAEEFEARGTVDVPKEDAEAFFAYYSGQYNLGNVNNFTVTYYNSNGGVSFSYPSKDRYDRAKTKEKLYEVLGVTAIEGNSPEEKLYNTVDLLRTKFKYNYATMYSTLDSCLDCKSGVCVHFAVMANELLLDSGVYSEVCLGYPTQARTPGSERHAWIRIWNGNNWVYSDPSSCVLTQCMTDVFIPMSTYIYKYQFAKCTWLR